MLYVYAYSKAHMGDGCYLFCGRVLRHLRQYCRYGLMYIWINSETEFQDKYIAVIKITTRLPN
jgi:hypothetical protein